MTIKRNDEILQKADELSEPGESKSQALLRALDDALGERDRGSSEAAQQYREALSSDKDTASLTRGIDVEQSGDDHLK